MINLNSNCRRDTHNHEFLGSGIHSQVYKSKTMGYATKVCQNIDQWPEYVIWATGEGFAGNLAPEVYAIREISFGYVATMELFERTISVTYDLPWNLSGLFDKYVYGWGLPLSIDELCLLDRYLPGYERFVASYRARFGNNWDIGGRNIMVRANGTLCITDPIGGCRGSSPARWHSGRSSRRTITKT